jgi:hypothetical protein
MLSIEEVNYDIIQGDTWTLDVIVKDENGTLINFDGYTFEMEVRDKEGGKVVCATASLGDGFTITGLGNVKIELTPEKTKKFTLPRAKYQIQYIDSSGRRKTLGIGWFKVSAGTIG